MECDGCDITLSFPSARPLQEDTVGDTCEWELHEVGVLVVIVVPVRVVVVPLLEGIVADDWLPP